MAACRPIPHWRQGGRSGAATVERGKLGPRDASSTKLQAGTQSLTKTPWDSGWLTSAGRVEPEISSQKRYTAHWRRVHLLPPRKQSRWDQGGDKMHSSPGETALAKHLVASAARTLEG